MGSANEESSSSGWSNHVFLSFRGDDTRKGFTDHLFASLERRGIKTFKDDHDLERGKVISVELMKAIEESMFALIILSPNYASSTWCLDELQKIVECKKEVFPVFYGVDPSDVRHQRGSFAEAFREHEEKFREDRKKVGKWRDALREVAGYSGWDSKNQHEAALIETIVGHLQQKLIPRLPCCTDNLVGIDSRMEEVISLMGTGLNDVRFIGIWGMGGIGKSTIARLVYEAIKEEFKVSCFLENVREESKTNGLVHIQKEFLSYLNVRSNDFYNLYDGKKIIANSLRNKKVLLVLDDVSELSQLENLAGKQEWFGPGSRVMITTRDKHLLTTHGVHVTCKAKGLAQNEALRLFCLKAFKQDQPKEEYLNLCKEVVAYARGLPLALEVLGSHLHGRTVEVWHSALEQIRSFPQSKIQDTLKISYDSLQPTEKKMFLDIACFFKGMDLDEVINILENSGDHPKIGIDILIERSLVTLDKMKNKFGMHDLLQEMGRNIVFQESPNDPGKRSRLWSQKDIDYVLTKNKGTDEIQGIVLNLVQSSDYEARWSTGAFSKISQLRLLKLCDMQLPLGLNCLPSALKVLHWKGCPLKTLPLNNQLDELVDLKLPHSRIEQLWHETKFLEMLKSIILSFSKNLKQSPDIVGVPNLESLVLEGCTSLTEVHPSLVNHKKLVMVNLKDCKRLKTFPSKMEMSSLKDLNLSGCSGFKYLPEFGESMEHLSMLSLEGTAITKLPSSLGCLVGLNHLDLGKCKNLVCLPDTIHKLKSLIVLNVFGCSKLSSLPEVLKEIKCLEELYAGETAIKDLPSFVFYLESLKNISFAGCKGPVANSVNGLFLPFKWLFGNQQTPTGFRIPPSIKSILNLPSLRRINLSYCNLSEDSIPDDFCHLSSLLILNLTGNNFVSLPSCISKLSKLEFLILNCCEKLQRLPELPSSMRGLEASNCSSLETSKFNPSKPCSLFASPTKWNLPREIRVFMEGLRLPKKRFDMIITGSEIPSWFVPQKYVSFANIPIPHNCHINEWVGFALCFLLISYTVPPEACHHEVDCYLFGPNGKLFISSTDLPPMEPCYPHLYILYLSIEKYREKYQEIIYEGGDNSEIEFVLKSYCCHSLEIVRCGCRLVCKQDVEDIYENNFEDLS
ncbi:TMV resistance protein N [Cajanus cajan]|uniref:ADP-ribosyl cyclase/cyclic ADP-ribose hydrolase n=1 Tax=Cajanus cajan TaxID=3821 RepID=A0A151UCT9_CAJCA|nr:TMV resistance protein N [Cajanus cajan]KYP77107.1 TMV resistance protein N [Cajanus cajan]